MAYEHFARRDYKAARPFADKALKLKPHHPLASYVKARLCLASATTDAALELLEPALDPERPNERVIDLLAELQMKAGNLDEAERLYELARKDDPVHTKWIAGLARVHLRQKDEAKFLADLAMLADNDADDLAVRKALAERYLAAGAADQGREVGDRMPLHRGLRPGHHALLADALAAQEKFAPAVEEYQTALDLRPKKPNDIKVRLARAQPASASPTTAKATLDAILKADPDHPEAKALREKLAKG